jgi:predicted nucleic acid-binding protein
LYGCVVVPTAVCEELRKPTSVCPAIEVSDFPHLQVRTPQTKPADLGVPPDLDSGESEAIALAIELRADLLLMDERKGTDVARQMGLLTIGVFGILLEAKRRNLVDQVLPLIDRLIAEMRFFATPALRWRLAELAGE